MEQEINIEIINTVSEIDIVYKSKVKASLRPKILNSKDAHSIFLKYWDENKIELVEQFSVMFLNRANKVLGIYQMSTGGITGTIADIRLLFAAALKISAVSFLVCHNHPSSNISASKSDRELTEKIKRAGELLDIKLLDHIIINADVDYYSMADDGLI